MSEVRYTYDHADITSGRGAFAAGNGFSYTPFYADEACTQMTGIWFWHPCSMPHSGSLGPNGQATVGIWTFTNTDTPERLTIRASIQCGPPPMGCGFHGFLSDGRWENC